MINERNLMKKAIPEHENNATSLLINIMKNMKITRDMCLNYFLSGTNINSEMSENLKKSVFSESIQNQYSTEEDGQPDIKIETENLIMLIEVKTDKNRGLTDYQTAKSNKNGYSKQLADKTDKQFKFLLFLIPDEYKYENKLINWVKGNSSEEFFIGIKYWKDLLSILFNSQISDYSSAFKELLDALIGITNTKLKKDIITFTPMEAVMMYSPEKIFAVMGAITKYSKILEDTKDIIKEKLGEDFSYDDYDSVPFGNSKINIGEWILYKNEFYIYHGYSSSDFGYSSEDSFSITIWTNTDDLENKKRRGNFYPEKDGGGRICFPIQPEKIFEDNTQNHESYVNFIVSTIENNIDLMK